jgi:hypothetical protein
LFAGGEGAATGGGRERREPSIDWSVNGGPHRVARDEHRLARGEEPLDIDAETDRQLRDLGG